MGYALEAHHTLIIDDSAFWPECRLDALVALVGFTGFTDGTDSQLCRQMIGGTKLTIGQLLQLKLIGNFGLISHTSNRVASSVKGMHRVQQGLGLIFSWSQFQEHRLFHIGIVAQLMYPVIRPVRPNAQAPKKERRIPPHGSSQGHPAAVLVKPPPSIMGNTGLEPVTSAMSTLRSSRLS